MPRWLVISTAFYLDMLFVRLVPQTKSLDLEPAQLPTTQMLQAVRFAKWTARRSIAVLGCRANWVRV